MRYGIFSDVHANLEALEAVIRAYKKEAIDRYLCIGDLVGYAADPDACIEKVSSLCACVVAGNHDRAAVGLFRPEYFNPAARQAIFWTKGNIDEAGRRFLKSLELIHRNEDLALVHGTLDNPQDFNYLTDGYLAKKSFGLMETNVCFVGHTHMPAVFIEGEGGEISYREPDAAVRIDKKNRYLVNVGSVGQPRDGRPQAVYCVYDTDRKEIRIKRISYDIEAARSKIIASGLPRFLGDRLLSGR